ncbi:hypothetical protein THTE_0693 [Thermogutta terrifontis]|uniref:Uncharacterized protein n=1 Tax=Thermogutta terrifontis TaxID=1331910 RepID=A0A286RBG5_9BACT|nr:hypothetical protein THTE_0693 [Thermogutta terrifontis]
MTYPTSPGTTGVPLRKQSGGTCLSRSHSDQPLPEGPACQVRRSMFDHPFPFAGD